MKRRRGLKKPVKQGLYSSYVIGSLVFSYLLIASFTTNDSPSFEIDRARIALANAKKYNCTINSSKLYKESEALYASAMKTWKEENKKFLIPLRHYGKVKTLATKAEKKAVEAGNIAQFDLKYIKGFLKTRFDSLNIAIQQFDSIFAILPLPEKIRKENVNGKLLFAESKIAYQNGKYQKSHEKMLKADEKITASFLFARNYLKEYFRQYPKWMQWVNNTLAESKSKSCSAIIVDKFSKKCYVYESGKLIYTFEIELGKNWVGDKKMSGDKATPEGSYQIIDKKTNEKTKYYKALLINYPNEDDQQQFHTNKSKGLIPRNSYIGGLIEIHGGGGLGANWTDGCIALHNRDMDTLFSYTEVGTTVTIVGSLKSLNKVLK